MISPELAADLDALHAASARVAAHAFDDLTATDALDVKARLEQLYRAQPAVDHRLTAQLTSQTTAKELGGKNWADVLATRLRISPTEAKRRLKDAANLGPRSTLTGEPLAPHWPNVAAGIADGLIGAEHLKIISGFFHELPDHIDHQTRQACEADLARIAREHSPEGLREAAKLLMALIHPDGELSDAERARRRGIHLGPQRPDGLSEIRGLVDPELRATLDAIWAKWAAPGMCNPDDETPCITGTPTAEQIQNDTRTLAQRQHDALKALARNTLTSGELGQHNGLPCTIIVTTTLKELESGCGTALTAGGTRLPMADVIRLAAHAHHYLVVFENHTQIPLYLGRSKRIASPGQRLVLYARDRGCTRPGCPAPAAWCQVDHTQPWNTNGPTDITNEKLACPPDNRLLHDGGWTTRKRKDGRIEWIPPPALDSGQARINNLHHPENFLVPPEEEDNDG
ncbi:HNH endonuclease signature motif containing protein [Mycobacterium hubeiense]|uniref:HNH endonuclease signature motif containing protein n=1 Tax=Mycobacterium hubeiense TaxID=1867256 RepID=UPI000C7EB073|nr:HNH endonuclease signature motif containing protein [Mycobacterium sp. QGD 101]